MGMLILTPFPSSAQVLRKVGMVAHTIDLFLYKPEFRKNVCLIIDDIQHVEVLVFWELLTSIKPDKIVLLGDMFEARPSKTKPNLLHDVLFPAVKNVVYLSENFRFANQDSLLFKNVIGKCFEKMDDSFHIITCGSVKEVETQILQLKHSGFTDITYICQYEDMRNKFNNLLLDTSKPVPIICRKNLYVNNYLVVFNGEFGFKINKTTVFKKPFEDVEYDLAYVLKLDDMRGRDSDLVVLIHIGAKINLEMLYIAASRAKKKFLLLSTNKQYYISC